MLLTVFLLTAVTLIFTWLAAGKIRSLQPIAAIRGISGDKGMKKNRFAMDRTPGSVNTVLMLKQMAASARQNVLLFIVLPVAVIIAVIVVISIVRKKKKKAAAVPPAPGNTTV